VKELLHEDWILKLLSTARDSRIKELEEEFVAWDEFKDLTNAKNDIMNLLEEHVKRDETNVLLQYDDAYGSLVAKASDYFYEKGFADCLNVLNLAQERKLAK